MFRHLHYFSRCSAPSFRAVQTKQNLMYRAAALDYRRHFVYPQISKAQNAVVTIFGALTCSARQDARIFLETKQKRLPTEFTKSSDCLYWPSPHFPVILNSILILFSQDRRLTFLSISPNCNMHVFFIMRTTCPAHFWVLLNDSDTWRQTKKYGALVKWYWQEKPKYSEKSLPKYHIVHHKSHMDYLVPNTVLRGEMSTNNCPVDVISLCLTLPMTFVHEQASWNNFFYNFFMPLIPADSQAHPNPKHPEPIFFP